jgi:drug/metabolite transporter (DMT)-like permease
MTIRALAEDRPRLVAAGLVALVSVLWTITELLPTLLTPGYSLYQVVWVRYGTHLTCMLLVLMPRYGWSMLHTRKPALQIGRGLLMIVMPASYIASIGHARASDVLAVFWLVPLLLLGLATVLQRDTANWPVWCAAVASVCGAQFILHPTANVLSAALFGLGMAISFSLYVVLTRTLRTERTMTNLFYSAFSVFIPLTFVMPGIWHTLTFRDALLMIGVGLVGLAVLWIIDRACELVPVSVFATVFPLQLVIITTVLSLFTAERPAKLALVGTALIVGSACVGWLLPNKRQGSGNDGAPVTVQVQNP